MRRPQSCGITNLGNFTQATCHDAKALIRMRGTTEPVFDRNPCLQFWGSHRTKRRRPRRTRSGGRIGFSGATFPLVLRICLEHRMDIDEEIMARIRAAKVWDKDSKLEDFQIRAAENGFVLINLKTGRAQLIYDENSELTDLAKLFPQGLLGITKE
jgi:hypothetical protein